EVEPISDVRGSRDFRLRLAENILLKFYHEVITDRGRDPAGDSRHADDRAGAAPIGTRATPGAPGLTDGRSVGRSIPHEPARAHVTGRAIYLDDIPPARDELRVEFVGSTLAHARIVALDVTEAAKVPGIAGVFTAADVPGANRFGPVFHDEELLA